MTPAQYAAARAGDLLARARLLTRDDARAEQVVVDALATLPRRLGDDPDEQADRALLRRAAAEPGGAARVASALRDVDGLTPDQAADVLGWSRRRVLRAAAAADAAAPVSAADRRPVVPPDLVDRVRAAAAVRRRRRTRVSALVAAAVVLVVAVPVTAGYVERRLSRLPTPHVAGLVAWPPRGELTHDTDFVRAAAREWRRHYDNPPRGRLGKIYVLYAGRIGVGRLALLQALDGRQGRVAVVAEHDVTFNRPVLQVDDDTALPAKPPLLLLVPYDGNLGLPGLQTGPGSQLLQALVAPDVDGLRRRSPASSSPGAPRNGFLDMPITGGLSRPWLDLSGQGPTTALRVYRHGRPVLDALVPYGDRLDPEPVTITRVPPPPSWSAVGPVEPQLVEDDALWAAQLVHRPVLEVAPIWSARQRPLDEPVRFMFIDGVGVFVVGNGAGSEFLEIPGTPDAFALTHVDPACLCLILVGSPKVARYEVGRPPTIVQGRAAVISVPVQVPALVALDAQGRALAVRRQPRG